MANPILDIEACLSSLPCKSPVNIAAKRFAGINFLDNFLMGWSVTAGLGTGVHIFSYKVSRDPIALQSHARWGGTGWG